MMRRKICVLTGTRADYGHLYWLLKAVQEDAELELQIVATGMHLSPEFGLTYKTIEADGFSINEKVEILLSSDTPAAIAKSTGLGLICFADVLARLDPDVLVVLGDRFETFAAAQAALVLRIPIAHIHGGETTEGAIDEAMRHSITKMAHFHFTAAEPYRRRVIQLGEAPERVMNYGAPGLDNIRKLTLLDRESLGRSIGFPLSSPSFLVTYHPVTLSDEDPARSFQELLAALDLFPEAKIIFTSANADTAGRRINRMIERYVEKHPQRAKAFTSLGQILYLSAVKNVDVILGNSSSGLLEAPALHSATVNVGDRQRGRLRSLSVIDCEERKEAIVAALQKALSPGFRNLLKDAASPYGEGDAAFKIKQYLKHVSLQELMMKRFHDVEFDANVR